MYRLVSGGEGDVEEIVEFDDAYAAVGELQRLVWQGLGAGATLRVEGPSGQLVADATDVHR